MEVLQQLLLMYSVKQSMAMTRNCWLNQAGFPYFEPREVQFIQCLKNPDLFIRGDYNGQHMSRKLIQYVVRCLLGGYNNIQDENGKSTIQMAFEGGNPAVLQAVLSIPPTLSERSRNWTARAQDLLDSSDGNDCVRFILRSCYFPSTDQNTSCCNNHIRYMINYATPPISRPLNPRPLAEVRGTRILCIDGGGTRGLVTLEILRQLEIQCGGTIAEYFDIIVGTSTGGLIALLLADGNRSVQDIRKLYFEFKNNVFSGRRGNLSEFNKLLHEFFGDRVMLNIPTSTRVFITTSVLGANRQLERRFFTNFHEESAGIKISQVARCTSAAPGYFPPFADSDGILYLDGGLTCNNPVFVALHQIRFQMENSVVVSIGTGRFVDPNPNSLLSEQFQNLRVSRSRPGQAEMILNGTLSRFMDILVNQVCKTDDEIVEDALLMCEQTKAYFYRLNPLLPENIQLDEVGDEELVNAIWHAKVFAENNLELFREIGRRLEDLNV